MDKMFVRVPVAVKAKVTQDLKLKIIGDLQNTIKNMELDLDELIRTDITLGVPYLFLCKEDCKGVCSGCGKNLNEESCECGKDEIDPRLEPLRKILEQMKKENK